jgi:excisionase family DNA binding protein
MAAAVLTLAERLSQPTPEPIIVETDDNGSLTVKDAAVRLNLSSKKVYRMCLAGELRCFRAGRAIRVPIEEIERFEQNGVAPATPRIPAILKRHY